MTTHPADGLYYVTENLLEEKADACPYGRAEVARRFRARGDKKIVATLANVTKQHNESGKLYYLIWAMEAQKLITKREVNKYYKNEGPQAFMDMLLSRAKREGLVR